VPTGSVWGERAAPVGETSDWEDLDPHSLAAMFATAAADLAGTPRTRRAVIEERLSKSFQAVLAEILFCNPNCGRSAVCRAEPIFPIAVARSDRR
jgi:hypothetical protein